ncbi:MAG TPA: helix-turn-helix domain-containing protein [Candidatus Latescibacteria bacterium]|nr:helix-turn-helix domain-containing protein [Candidatus Latescibacterota bacterium]HOS66030.1 helix-turn-helix domain-containing protein [Candidatus Latescibacterota bacterium]HRT28353.1 helix-turn-helix domain-containing protein [Kiritimatiellia bacterium]
MGRNDEFEHLSGHITASEIGLGWLDGLTLRTVSKAASFRPHQHSHMEVILCLRGELVYRIGSSKPILLGSDMGIVIPAHIQHSLKDDSESPSERIGLHLLKSMSAHHSYAVFSRKDYANFQKNLSKSAKRPFRLSPALKVACRELSTFLKRPSGDICSAEYGQIRILCCSILYNLVKILSAPPSAIKPQLMDEAVRFLESHYAESIHVEDLVKHMGYSRARLFTLFKRHTGLTPNDFLIRFRINKAKEMLRNSTLTVAEVATATGFSGPEYFYTVFKRYVGVTPSEYRRGHEQGTLS